MAWELRGEYAENCSCDLFCPCLLGPRDAQRGLPVATPTAGHCDILAIVHVQSGRFDDVALQDLTAVLAIHIPARMADGDWDVTPYLPQQASAAARMALEAILLGRAGGPMARVAAVVGRWRQPAVVPMRYIADGLRRRVDIPGLLELEIEALPGRDGRKEVWIDNVRHMAARALAVALARRGRWQDGDRRWDHSGKNAHYGPFEWAG